MRTTRKCVAEPLCRHILRKLTNSSNTTLPFQHFQERAPRHCRARPRTRSDKCRPPALEKHAMFVHAGADMTLEVSQGNAGPQQVPCPPRRVGWAEPNPGSAQRPPIKLFTARINGRSAASFRVKRTSGSGPPRANAHRPASRELRYTSKAKRYGMGDQG